MKMAVDRQLPLGVPRTLGEIAGPHVAFFMSIWVDDELGDFMRERLNLGSGRRFLIFERDGRQVVIVAKDPEAMDRTIDLSDVARHLVERAAEAGISIVQREAQA
jgi:bifunctional DNA-binding transcriptional regulator/antitoxin component of YhaV-PrlF toxin-antitoxin module